MNLSKEQKIILYLIKNINPTKIKRTLIFKLLFLADIGFYEVYGRKITDYVYSIHKHGPFAQLIYEDLEYLELGRVGNWRATELL